jgi:nucleoside-diphosphate-sugar epimerase
VKVLITGSNGFIGRHLSEKLKNFKVIKPDRSDWNSQLKNIDCVIHLAGRAHVLNKNTKTSLKEYRDINVKKTLNFAKKAALAGAKRFIFISSIKVNGETTALKKFTAHDIPAPKDAYAISKLEAEKGLRKIASQTDMEVVIIRPPLVYGPGVRANFLSLLHCINYFIPLPFGMISNKRSFISIDNLTNLIIACIMHPKAANKIFLASDGRDISLSNLLLKISKAFNKPCILIPIPSKLLSIIFAILGMKKMKDSLLSPMQIDIEYTKKILGWQPSDNIDKVLLQTVSFYQSKFKITAN